MFFEIWKKQNKKRLDTLNKIAPYIEPSEQFKNIGNLIFNDDLEQYRQVNGSLNDEGNRVFSEKVKVYLNNKKILGDKENE